MNYKDKYLKYKLKYLNIEKNNNNLIGGTLTVHNWNRLKLPSGDLDRVINDIKKSQVILIVGHGGIEPKLEDENVADLDLKNNIVIGLNTFRRIKYNRKFLNSLNKNISEQLKKNTEISIYSPIINTIEQTFKRRLNQETQVYIEKMPIKNFYIDLTNYGIYYYTREGEEGEIKINLLEYTDHYPGEDLKDIIDNFSNNEPKIFIVYSCHNISDFDFLEKSPILLTEQHRYGKSGPDVIPDLELPESVSDDFSTENIQVIPADGIPNNQKDKILPQNKLKKKKPIEECETCNKSFCNIQ